MRKTSTIKLTVIWPDKPDSEYRIESITDSVDYTPGTMLTKKQVSALCEKPLWKVTINRPAN